MDPTFKDHESTSDVEKHSAPVFLESAALPGHVATDEKGRALITIDEAAEAKLRMKIDLHIIPTVAVLYLFCFIDRANIGNARLAGLERDLHLRGYDFNTVLSIFYVSYILCEIPSNLLCKIVGPGRYLPLLTFLFGLFSMATAFVHTKGAILAVRFLLGVAEAGMLPGIAYYLSRWYRKSELVFRLSLYIVTAPLAGAFGGLLASGILKIRGIGSVHTWQMIFLIEGIITMGIAVIAFFTLTDRPDTARWLSTQEKALAISRIKSENVGMTAVLDTIHKKAVYQGLFSANTLTCGLIFLLDSITAGGIAFFLPTIVRSIFPTASVISLQLRTVPPYVVGAFFTVLVPFLFWKTKRHAFWMMVSAPLMMAGSIMFVASKRGSVRYAGTFLGTSGAFSFGALCNAWAASNVTSDTARSAAIGFTVMSSSVGSLISTWTFLPYQAPNYVQGNSLNIGTSAAIFVAAGALWYWQVQQNRRKANGEHDHRLVGLNVEEVEALGIRHPGFVYTH